MSAALRVPFVWVSRTRLALVAGESVAKGGLTGVEALKVTQ
jgi:hypothetical protein